MVLAERTEQILRKHDPWLYVDSSERSHEALAEATPFVKAGLITVYDVYKDGGFKESDVPLPRLMFNGDVLVGAPLLRHLQFLKKLNEQFLQEEERKEAL